MPKFKPRQRKHKQRRREEQSSSKRVEDTNVTELLPESKAEREERREALREELRSQQPQVSSKKKKRLDKYIVCINQSVATINRFLR
jgi:ATP-dependent RNA helicase DHX37/DHR1